MKKRLLAGIMGMMAACSLMMTACGQSSNEATTGTEEAENATEESESEEVAAAAAFDIKGSDYVTLCDYSAIPVTIYGDYEVTDATVSDYFANLLETYGPFYVEDATKTTVGEGDIVNVDYVGKLDGEAFSGGSAESQLIDVSGNCSADGSSYIEGFTDGLMGAKVGDVIDCDVTFPDNYGNSDLAGKDVVFTFTINSIQRVMEVADADDAFAQEQFSVDTVEEMYTQIEEYLVQLMDYYKVQNTLTAIQEYLIENCEANVPDDYLEARLSDYIRSYVENNCDGDESQLEDIASSYYDTDADGLKEQWRESMRESIQLELIMDAITEELGLTIDEDAYAEYVSTLISNSSSYSDEDSMYEYYGYGDRAYGETYFRKLYLYDRALDEVEATAVVTIRPEDEDPDAETDETEATETLEDTEE